MPLVPAVLEASILQVLNDFEVGDKTPEQAKQEFAQKLSTAIDTYIRTATVSTPAGPGTIS